MKHKLLLLSMMCMIAISTWAKDMTVRIIDSNDTPIPELKVYITDSGSSYNGDTGEFITNANGEFTMTRTNLNFLKMEIHLPKGGSLEYELVWNGSDDTVIITMEGYYWLTFILKGIEANLYPLISQLILNDRHWDTYNVTWDEEGKTSLLYEGTSLTWKIGGNIIGASNSDPIDLTTHTGAIEINNPLKGMQQVNISLKDENGTLVSGEIDFKNIQSYTSYTIQTSSEEAIVYYMPKTTYEVSTTSLRNETKNYAVIKQKFILGNEPAILDLSYEGAKKLTIKVTGIDGENMPNADISGLAYYSKSVDENGEVTFITIPGTYSYSVSARLDQNREEDYHLWEEVKISDKDMMKTVTYQGKYFRISMDIKLPTFITDVDKLIIFSSEGGMFHYNENTKLYSQILRKTEDGYISGYNISYPNMFIKTCDYKVTKHETISIDLTQYHAVTFTPSDAAKYALSDIHIYHNDPYGSLNLENNSNTGYLEDGEYTVKATVTDLNTKEVYKAITPQTLTIKGADQTVTYTLNTNDYHKVTVTVTGADGMPMAGQEVRIYDNKSGNGIGDSLTDKNGKAVFNLSTGTYKCYVNPSKYSPNYEETFTIADKDVAINASFGNYKKLTVNLTGTLLSELNNSCNITIYNYTIGVEKSISFGKDYNGNWTSYNNEFYLLCGNYSYSVENDNRLKIRKDFELTGNQELTVNLSSSDYHKVTLKVVDENGEQVTNGTMYVQTPNGQRIFELDASQTRTVYLPDGVYKGAYLYNDHRSVVTQDFTVSGGNKNVTFTYKEPGKECVLTIKAKGLKKEGIEIDYLRIYFDCNGFNVGIADMNINQEIGEGETSIELPTGTYTYSVRSTYVAQTGTITITKDQELILDYTSFGFLSIFTIDEDGNIISGNDDEEWEPTISLNQNGKSVSANQPYLFGLFPQGTYEIWAWCYGYKVVTQSVTVTDQDQRISIKLPKANPNKFILYFNINDEYNREINDATVNLTGYGEYPTIESELFFSDVTSGSISYTVKADGYETYTGTVNVNEDAVDTDGLIEIYVYLKSKEAVAIKQTETSTETAFSVYPVAADEYVHIAPAEKESTVWMIRLAATTGATVYSDKQVIDGEAKVYVGNLPKGLYILTLCNGKQMKTYKIIKK